MAEGNRSGEAKLSADGGAEGVGKGLAEALDVGVVFGFDHDACELLGAGIAEDDAAVFAECGLSFGESAGDCGERFERGFRTDFYVDDGLWIVLEALDEGFDLAAHGDERSDFHGGEKAVAERSEERRVGKECRSRWWPYH